MAHIAAVKIKAAMVSEAVPRVTLLIIRAGKAISRPIKDATLR